MKHIYVTKNNRSPAVAVAIEAKRCSLVHRCIISERSAHADVL